MALNLSKKVDSLISSAGGSLTVDESATYRNESSSNSNNVFQPLDLSLKGYSSPVSAANSNNSDHHHHHHQRKRLLPWSTSKQPISSSKLPINNNHNNNNNTIRSHVQTSLASLAGNSYDNVNIINSSEDALTVDDDDSKSAMSLFDDNPNENGIYVCHFCDTSTATIFQTWASVQSHLQTCHPNERPYACPFAPSCPYNTKWFCDMRVHFRRHHPEVANSPRQLYDAIQLVKDRTTTPIANPALAAVPPPITASNNLLMVVSKHMTMPSSSSLPSSPPSASSSPPSSTARPNSIVRPAQSPVLPLSPPPSFFQHQQQQQQGQQQQFGNHNKFEFNDPPFWAKAVCQQRSSDIRSVKAIKIDCRSVHKALSNHRQQQQLQDTLNAQMTNCSSSVRSFGNSVNSSSNNALSQASSLIAPSPRSIPYKFQCPLCNYRTQRQTNFECHVACHENLRIYKCSACAYRSNWKWDLKKHIRQVHPIVVAGSDGSERRQPQPVEKILIGKMDEGDSLDGGDHVEGAAKILVMPLEEARRTVDNYLKQVGKSAEKFLLKCVLCPFVTKRRKLLSRHHQQSHGLRPEECCNTDEYVMALPSSPSSQNSSGGEGEESLMMPETVAIKKEDANNNNNNNNNNNKNNKESLVI